VLSSDLAYSKIWLSTETYNYRDFESRFAKEGTRNGRKGKGMEGRRGEERRAMKRKV
jgi:hypothetical protein